MDNKKRIKLSIIFIIIGTILIFVGYFKTWVIWIGVLVYIIGFFIDSRWKKKTKKKMKQDKKMIRDYLFFRMG